MDYQNTKPKKPNAVLDLDNTLWGGVIGEDGMDGIQIGHDYPGNAFRALQQVVIKLNE